MDIVALHRMNVRAMENWGCVTFSRTVLLMDQKSTPAKDVQRSARIVAHELAHMWFGNLVTTDWWDDIWLNEGFARYAEHHILNNLRPEFRSWDKYLDQVYRVAIGHDTKIEKTHPVQLKVPDPDNLMDVFDTISYAKGSVICRMLSDYVGEETFKACLTKYMHTFKYRCATTHDLLSVMDAVTAGNLDHLDSRGQLLPPSEFIMPWIS